MKKNNGGANEYAKTLISALQDYITECEILLCEQEMQTADSSYNIDDLQFEERRNNYTLDYDYFINNDIWSVRKMLPEEFYGQKNIVMVYYLYAFISRCADYYSNLHGMRKDEIAKEVFDFIESDKSWINIDAVLNVYLENIKLPDDHAAIINEYNTWVSIIG
jgi:hypothetical protein